MTTPRIIDLESERAVLGSILLDPRAILSALDEVQASDFQVPAHRLIFQAMVSLEREKQPIDIASVCSVLDTLGQLTAVGGRVAVFDFSQAIASAANAGHFARRVSARARLARFVAEQVEILESAGGAADAAEYLQEAQSRLLKLTEEIRDDIVPADRLARDTFKRLETASDAQETPGLITGFAGLDRANLFRRGALVTLAARPGQGKTACAQGIALGVAERGRRVLFVSIEMGAEELADRFVASRALIDTGAFARARFDEVDWKRIHGALSGISELALDTWPVASRLSIEQLRIRALRMHALRPLDLVVVDYLQLMQGDRGDGRVQEVSSITRGLKVLAKELGATILALSQLNRECEKRCPPIPQLSDLRDSGSVEQDSDAVIFIYRPHAYDETADLRLAELHIAKHRHGPVGRFRLTFHAPHQLFSDQQGTTDDDGAARRQ